MSLTRRRFLEDSLLAAAAAVVASNPLPARALGGRKNPDALRVGVIGVRGRGRDHIASCRDLADAEVAAICDADEGVIGPAMKAAPDAVFVKDIRRLLEDKTIDAVSIAMPNHWHALAAVWALQAGKHVFVEKPASHDLAQGRALVRAAAKYGRVVQHGTQARSHAACRDAIAWMQAGGIGEVNLATGLCFKPRGSIGQAGGEVAPPATCDYDLWTGPAELRPLRRKNLHYDWHWDFSTGNGDIGNQGVHQMDLARWGLGLNSFPARVASIGGRLGYQDDGETPNSQLCFYDWGAKKIIFEVRGLKTAGYKGASIGTIFHGAGGWLVIEDYAKAVAFNPKGEVMKVFEGGGDHFADFLAAIRAGGGASAPAIEGHLSSGLCHLGNIPWRLAEAQPMNKIVSPFAGDAGSEEACQRFRQHLSDNGLAADVPVHASPVLAFDASTERFSGPRAAEADALGAPALRAPYLMPKEV